MTKTIQHPKKRYIPPQIKIYNSLKDITAVDTCLCIDVKCDIYCTRYAYPFGGNCPYKYVP
jgi:hypothetical protein